MMVRTIAALLVASLAACADETDAPPVEGDPDAGDGTSWPDARVPDPDGTGVPAGYPSIGATVRAHVVGTIGADSIDLVSDQGLEPIGGDYVLDTTAGGRRFRWATIGIDPTIFGGVEGYGAYTDGAGATWSTEACLSAGDPNARIEIQVDGHSETSAWGLLRGVVCLGSEQRPVSLRVSYVRP